MFAYCNNNPIAACDATGTFPDPISLGLGILAGAALLIFTHVTFNTVAGTAKQASHAMDRTLNQVTEYSKQARARLASQTKKRPHIHHIVPKNQFKHRSYQTQQNIKDMHQKLERVGINRFVNPINLVLVSAGTHARLHTDAYISHVHQYVMSAGNTTEEVYLALFYLRIEIAAMDMFADGY